VQFEVTPKKQPSSSAGAPGKRTVDSDTRGGRSSVGSDGTAYREWSDLDLVASLVDECGDGYAELYRRHSRSVAAAARMILSNDARCEDVVAEVFVSLWFHPEKFDPSRGTLLAFLRLRAKGRSIDIVRTETARRRREERDRVHVASLDDVDAGILSSEGAVAIRNALDLLPLSEREPIYLAFFSGMTYQAVAARLKLPEGTVKSRIRSGLRHLQANDGVMLQHSPGDPTRLGPA
jgi:RNA polymerase sigma-70 factor (ECF subfamily)